VAGSGVNDAAAETAAVRTRIERFFADHPSEFAAIYLFGSVARGAARPGSDVDIGVLHETEPPSTLAAVPATLETELTRALGLPVQIVVLDTAPVDLVHRVMRDGLIVEERNPSRRIAFEVRTRNEYFDLLPVLRRYREPRRAEF
jgi:predicted nucleotidyltransferase